MPVGVLLVCFQLDRALSMYAEMQRNGVAINTVTFNSIVDACARVGAMDKAAMLLEDMLSQGGSRVECTVRAQA